MKPKAHFTLGQLCKQVGLARSSVLHYESIGLLRARGRSPAGYRLYGEAELARLRSVRRLREAGLPLVEILALLRRDDGVDDKGAADPAALLENRLIALSEEAERIRGQQRGLARLLALADFGSRRVATKADWVALLRRAGFDEAAMRAWHGEFERDQPQEHAAFLASLGLAAPDADAIRRWSRESFSPEP